MPPEQVLQPILLLAAAAAYVASFFLGLHRLRNEARDPAACSVAGKTILQLADRPCQPGMKCFLTFMIGTGLALVLLAWRAVSSPPTLPLGFNNDLDVFLLLGLALAAIMGYIRITHHLLGFALFIVPMIGLVMAIGAVLALLYHGRPYSSSHTVLTVIHVATIASGSLCFAIGCVGGGVYLLADRQLRHRNRRWLVLPSLAALERFTQRAILLGFPLLTLAIITGFIRAFQIHEQSNRWAVQSKMALSLIAWVAYAPLLHTRLLPAFRGKRAAWLSIIGFALLLSIFVVSTWILPNR